MMKLTTNQIGTRESVILEDDIENIANPFQDMGFSIEVKYISQRYFKSGQNRKIFTSDANLKGDLLDYARDYFRVNLFVPNQSEFDNFRKDTNDAMDTFDRRIDSLGLEFFNTIQAWDNNMFRSCPDDPRLNFRIYYFIFERTYTTKEICKMLEKERYEKTW